MSGHYVLYGISNKGEFIREKTEAVVSTSVDIGFKATNGDMLQ
jgi:hypothetical protein